MKVKVNVLDYIMEEVLSMKCENGRWRLVMFLSKSLNKIERNYEIYDKEMLAVIKELENWRHLLEDTQYKFKIWTNHKNLKYFMKAQKLNRRQAYQILYLSRFDFILKHVPDTKIEKTNELSKQLDWKVGVDKDNENQTLIKEQQIYNLSEVVIEGLKEEIIEKIKIARSKNKKVVRVVEGMKKAEVKML